MSKSGVEATTVTVLIWAHRTMHVATTTAAHAMKTRAREHTMASNGSAGEDEVDRGAQARRHGRGLSRDAYMSAARHSACLRTCCCVRAGK